METKKNTAAISCCCSTQPKKVHTAKKTSALNIISAVVFFLFPKCPLCWAAYGSFFSLLGFENLQYNPIWQYVVLGVFILGSLYLLYKHYKNKAWLNMGVYLSGIAILFFAYALNYSQNWWLILVSLLIIVSNFHLKKHIASFKRLTSYSTVKAN